MSSLLFMFFNVFHGVSSTLFMKRTRKRMALHTDMYHVLEWYLVYGAVRHFSEDSKTR